MNKELIKKELSAEITALIDSDSITFDNTSGLVGKLEMWQAKLDNVKDFSQTIIDKLNEILQNHNIEVNEIEKSELLEYLKPTVQDLIVKNLRK